jgi:GT2 family glycosyltransferase
MDAPSDSEPKVAVVILHWGDPTRTHVLLASICRDPYRNLQIFVIDQSSNYEEFHDQLEVTVVRPSHNLGYGAGNNRILNAITPQEFPYALLLNNDVEVEPRYLSQLVHALESSSKAVAASPTILTTHTSPQCVWYGGGKMLWWRGASCHLQQGELHDPSSSEPVEVSFVSGCCLLIRVEALEQVGAFDEDYFLYWEDTAWSTKVLKSGLKLLYVPQAQVRHHASSSLGWGSPEYVYYNLRNHLRFIRTELAPRWRPTARAYFLYRVGLWSLRAIQSPAHERAPKLRSIWRAIYDNARRRYGPL